jgi:hypothetical protein
MLKESAYGISTSQLLSSLISSIHQDEYGCFSNTLDRVFGRYYPIQSQTRGTVTPDA